MSEKELEKRLSEELSRVSAKTRKQCVKVWQDHINDLREMLAACACPFKIGDVIKATRGYYAGHQYKIIEISPSDHEDGYRMVGRKYGVSGQLTLVCVDLWTDLDLFVKVR